MVRTAIHLLYQVTGPIINPDLKATIPVNGFSVMQSHLAPGQPCTTCLSEARGNDGTNSASGKTNQ